MKWTAQMQTLQKTEKTLTVRGLSEQAKTIRGYHQVKRQQWLFLNTQIEKTIQGRRRKPMQP